jgi:exonuclease SbcC
VQACQNDITVLEKKIETYQGMLKDLPELDLEKENERLQQSKKQDALLLQKQGARDADIAQNKALKKQIQVLFKAFQEESETYSWMKTLSDTANGNISGQDKIDLQASYQTEYFKQILRFANRYFTKMTNGKYELLHRNAGLDKKSQAGLNIDVKDYNQTIRDVSTLSGGESFLASLSLALGLSDCVQQEAGGFILDTMFVDEGFGTLDDETLQVVLSSLKELSKTGRLIGLISHVSELKKSISKQIVIESSKSGASQAKIIA